MVTRQNIFPLMLMIGISIIPVMSIHMPRALSFTPLLLGLLMSLWWVFIKKEPYHNSKAYIYCIISICALCIISTLWSIEPMEAYIKSLKTSAILLFSIPLFNLACSIKIETIKPFSWLLPIGVTAAALLCSFELAFDLPIYKSMHDTSHKISSAVMNRGVVSVVFAYFAALLFINNIDCKKLRIALIAIMSLSVIIMLALTQSQSGQLAFGLGVITILAIPHRHKFTHRAIALLIISVLILTPWIVEILFNILINDAQELPWLKDAYAGNRVEIWDFVMNYALNNPLYGYGMEATRFVSNFEHDYIYHAGPTILHPHNFAVQLWIEFGVIGVISASALIYFIMLKISNLELIEKRITTAIFIAILTVSAVGYGLWQSWWVGELVFITAICAIAAKRKL